MKEIGPKLERKPGSLAMAVREAYIEGTVGGKKNPYDDKATGPDKRDDKEQILGMIHKMLSTFIDDPADNEFQRGYHVALKDVYKAINANHWQDR